MAKVIVFTPDLLFGSSLVGALSAHGHSAVMCSGQEAVSAEAPGAACVIIDLTDEIDSRLAELEAVRELGLLSGVALLGYYSHVEPESREAGVKAGISAVVPRSRMHREPAVLVDSAIAAI
jgi:hypothetical protein